MTLNNICGKNSTINIPRYISKDYLINMTKKIDTMDQNMRKKYSLIIEYSQQLNYMLIQKMIDDDKCIDIEKTNRSDLIMEMALIR